MNNPDFLKLAAFICYDNVEKGEPLDKEEIRNRMMEKFKIDLDQFILTAEKLIDYTPTIVGIDRSYSIIKHTGFIHNGYLIVKKQVHRSS